MASQKTIALTLSGGGARAAYQAGVLRAIAEIHGPGESPFQLISGVSAGAINGMWLAGGAGDFRAAAEKMWDLWSSIHTSDIFKTDGGTLLGRGFQWIETFATGNLLVKETPSFIFDTSPLKTYLGEHIDFGSLSKNLRRGILKGVSVSATNYHRDKAVTFFMAPKSVKPWVCASHCGERAELAVEHVMASSALPIFFPPQKIGAFDYGDGGVGLKAPLSPSICLGADKILAIGIHRTTEPRETKERRYRRATIGDVSGTLLNSVLFGSMDGDVERCRNINAMVKKYPGLKKEYREIPLLTILPSRDLGQLGSNQFSHFPFAVRHLLRGFGVSNKKSWDLLSYLAFNHHYASELLRLGHGDAMARKAEIRVFLRKDA